MSNDTATALRSNDVGVCDDKVVGVCGYVFNGCAIHRIVEVERPCHLVVGYVTLRVIHLWKEIPRPVLSQLKTRQLAALAFQFDTRSRGAVSDNPPNLEGV